MQHGSLARLGLALLLAACAVACVQSSASDSCPLAYPRHSLEDVRAGQRPYLFGGIYSKTVPGGAPARKCANCGRGGLWSKFCGFDERQLRAVPFWHMQLCNASTIDTFVKRVLAQGDAEEVLSTTPCDLWAFMRGRTTWVIGDSMSKDLFKALRCFMVEFQDLKTYHATNNYTAMHLLHSIPGYGEPHCVHMPDATRLCQLHVIQGDLFVRTNRTSFGGVLPMLLAGHLAQPADIFIMNTGLWHGETKQDEYKQHLHQLGGLYASVRKRFPNMFFMETPKQHFDSADGDFKVPWLASRKGPWRCQPIKGVSLAASGALVAAGGDAVAAYVAAGSWRNQFAREILGSKYKMPFVEIYNATVTAWDLHRRNLVGQECSHFCHPSLPQLWVVQLLRALRRARVPPVAGEPPAKQHAQRGCAHVYERDEAKFGKPLEQQAVLDEHARQRSFWDWLFGRNRLVLHDGGVLLPATDAASHEATLTPWQSLAALLEERQQLSTQRRAQQQVAQPPQGQPSKAQGR